MSLAHMMQQYQVLLFQSAVPEHGVLHQYLLVLLEGLFPASGGGGGAVSYM
jgi:hypothetical protein